MLGNHMSGGGPPGDDGAPLSATPPGFAEAILDTAQAIVLVLAPDGSIAHHNRYLEELCGYTRDEITGKDWFETFLPPRDRARIRSVFERALREPSRTTTVNPLVARDGHEIDVEWRDTPLFDATGGLTGVLAVGVDVTERRRSEEAQKKSQLFRQIADNVDLVLWVTSADQKEVLYLNPAFERVWGRSVAEVHRDPSLWIRTVHPEDRQRVLAMFSESPASHEQTHRIVRPDGSERWVHVRVFTVHDDAAHVVRTVGVAADVTAARAADEANRRALAEKSVLLQEIHHRVKNNLQVISSLLYLQSRRAADPGARQALEDSRDRVASLALIHETLYESKDLAQVDFERYLRRLVTGLVDGYAGAQRRVRVALEVAPLQLDVSTALPCGLVANELVTNALRHAFPGERTGSVTVRISRDAENCCHMTVQDDGIGIASAPPPDRKSLGWTLVETLARQLGGTLTVSGGPGTAVTLCFPLPRRPANGLAQ